MGFLKNFFTDVYANETKARPATGFQQLSEVDLEAHLNVCRYGDFELTDAVRPSYTLEVVPSAGYRHDTYRDEENRAEVPVLMAAVTRPFMMDAFMSSSSSWATSSTWSSRPATAANQTATPISTANTSTCRSSKAPSGTSRTF